MWQTSLSFLFIHSFTSVKALHKERENKCSTRPEFLNLRTIDVLDEITYCCGGLSSARHWKTVLKGRGEMAWIASWELVQSTLVFVLGVSCSHVLFSAWPPTWLWGIHWILFSMLFPISLFSYNSNIQTQPLAHKQRKGGELPSFTSKNYLFLFVINLFFGHSRRLVESVPWAEIEPRLWQWK